MCCLEAAELSSQSVSLPLQLVDLKPVIPEVLPCPVTVLVAFQLALESAVRALHLSHLSGREARTEKMFVDTELHYFHAIMLSLFGKINNLPTIAVDIFAYSVYYYCTFLAHCFV